jgi:hypothetical protein
VIGAIILVALVAVLYWLMARAGNRPRTTEKPDRLHLNDRSGWFVYLKWHP